MASVYLAQSGGRYKSATNTTYTRCALLFCRFFCIYVNFTCLYLNTKNQVIHRQTIFIGSLNTSIVHPREVFKEAFRRAAASIICLHNHPSGDPTPSREDIEVTKRLVECGQIIGIEVLDHIIIGDHKFVSLKEKGHI